MPTLLMLANSNGCELAAGHGTHDCWAQYVWSLGTRFARDANAGREAIVSYLRGAKCVRDAAVGREVRMLIGCRARGMSEA